MEALFLAIRTRLGLMFLKSSWCKPYRIRNYREVLLMYWTDVVAAGTLKEFQECVGSDSVKIPAYAEIRALLNTYDINKWLEPVIADFMEAAKLSDKEFKWFIIMYDYTSVLAKITVNPSPEVVTQSKRLTHALIANILHYEVLVNEDDSSDDESVSDVSSVSSDSDSGSVVTVSRPKRARVQ